MARYQGGDVSAHHLSTTFTRSVASLAHREFSASRLRGSESARGAKLASSPIPVHDTNGEPLFHDYLLEGPEGVVGTIRTAAHRALGSPLVSVSHGAPGWEPGAAVRLAVNALHASAPDAIVESSRLVCYAYPKLAVELAYRVGSERATGLFDASSGNPVLPSDDTDNQVASYSMLESLAGVDERLEAFARSEAAIAAAAEAPELLHFPLVTSQQVLLSPYCPDSPIGLTHYAQILDYFCVDASAQMLLEHYGWNYTQNQIAGPMGTSAAQGGTTGAGLTSGFKLLTDATLLLTFDGGASRDQQFADAVTEISANRPLFTQVPHHYRVCVGYSDNFAITLLGGDGRMLYIYDPWPWNPDQCSPGSPYWESWNVSPVMWFGIVHHA